MRAMKTMRATSLTAVLVLLLALAVVPAAKGQRNTRAYPDHRLYLPLAVRTPLKGYLPIVMHGSPAGGREDITYSTGFDLQNLGADEADLRLTYYNQDGTIALEVRDAILAMGSKSYYPIHPEEGFNGSVVISSDQRVVAVANLRASGAVNASSAANSFSEGALTVYLPLIMRGFYGLDTWFNVQNAGTTTTHVTVTYIPGEAGNAGVTEEADIPPGAAYTFDQVTNAALGERFVGSAVVTSDGQPLVATVEQVGSTESFMALMSYNGFVAGSSTVNLPLVMANNYGFYTGIQCQNGGTIDTQIVVDYGPNTAGIWEPTDESATVAPGRSHTFLQLGEPWPEPYVGPATVTNSQNQPLMCIVNQVMAGTAPADPDFGTAYEGFGPASATERVSLPLVITNYGYTTSLQVQNVDTLPVTIFVPSGLPILIDPGESVSFSPPGPYVGSMTIAATGKIVALVNTMNPSSNDEFTTYNAFNY
jgi:hypothetical protein